MIAYDGYQVTPGGFLSIERLYNEMGNGKKVGKGYQITLEGKFLPNKGSPTSSGTSWAIAATPTEETITADGYLTSMINKQKALQNLFTNDGKQFYVQGYDSGATLTCNPRVKNIQFPKGGGQTSWAQLSDYRITLEAETLYVGGVALVEGNTDLTTYHVENAEDAWNLEVLDENIGTYRYSRQLSAKGKTYYSSSGTQDYQPWEYAQSYVLNKLGLGINMTILKATGVLNDTGLSGYNYLRTQNLNVANGTFSVGESWIAFNPMGGYPASDTYDIDVKTDNAGFTQVDLKGKIEGFEVRNGSSRALISSKYTNANGKYLATVSSFLQRASGTAGVLLNPVALNSTTSLNPITGVINYNVSYDNRKTPVLAGATMESISVNFEYACDLFAEIGILGRAAGPLLQSIQSQTAARKTISVEAVFPARTQIFAPTKPDTNVLVSGLMPIATYVGKSRDSESWSEATGKYSRNTTFTYTN